MATKYHWQQTVSHTGLNKYRVVKAATRHELEEKVEALRAQWDEQWERQLEKEERELERKEKQAQKAEKIKNDMEAALHAERKTKSAEMLQNSLENLLLSNLNPEGLVIDELKDFSEFSEPCPQKPELEEVPPEPCVTDEKYNPIPSFFTKIFKSKMEEFSKKNQERFEMDHKNWENLKKDIEKLNLEDQEKYQNDLHQWEKKKRKFEKNQISKNKEVDLFFEKFKQGENKSVEEYFVRSLEKITFPFQYKIFSEMEYNAENKTLIVDITLPTMNVLPNIKSVSYIKSRKEYKETVYSESYMNKKYDSVIYQIVLLTLNCIFSLSDNYHIIDSVVVNGKIKTIDKATGQPIEPCILSINVSRDSFEKLNLQAIDPKTWFKSAKGISAACLANTTPVAPVISISHEDKRFIEGYSVSDKLNEQLNLAAIDWQDFENLIREIFEKEFNTNGGEVKITQASRDGGVDAVAFDPDPIRGGKIVIQAKRYTNVVGVSAVRDLYGTVLNEGATKGILVTTSNYGNDAYTFAQGKPITLMNGANLLYLLEKHGYKAKIDLKEAKEVFHEVKNK